MQTLSKIELTRKLNDAGYKRVFVELSKESQAENLSPTIVHGEISFDSLPSGIHIHCTDTVETYSGKSTAEIYEGININFLLSGNVGFGFDDRYFHFSAATQPITFVSCIGKPQLFTRFLSQDTHVRKLNLSVSKSWLMSRCNSLGDEKIVESICSQENEVYHWPCTSETTKLVEKLLTLHQNKSLITNLHAEHLAFHLFSDCYQQLSSAAKAAHQHLIEQQANTANKDNNYELQLEKIIHKTLTLPQIAKQLGASISSLQRYFKAKHHLTIKEYIRTQKLEHARRLLVFEKKSIGEAAYAAGYNHVSNFSAAFKKHFAISPSQLMDKY